ncbi:Rgg family transcriptional regulator, partial [Streptococcus pneumoniae]
EKRNHPGSKLRQGFWMVFRLGVNNWGILLNGFLASIECEEFTNAYYFKRVIEEHFYKENETYFRIVYLWAEGLLDSKQGRVKEGQKKMEDAVRIFEMLGCNKSAEYYRNTTEC